MSSNVPAIARTTFLVHLIVAVVLGLLMLVMPEQMAGWWGIDYAEGYDTTVRTFGAAILGLGAVTSFYGYRARSWEQIDFVVRGEIVYLVLQVILYVVALIQGAPATVMNAITFVITLALLVLFLMTWMRRAEPHVPEAIV